MLGKWPALEQFLQQELLDVVPVDAAWRALDELLGDIDG
jgi:hypothetical protein